MSDLEKEGLIQRFEYSYELAWKTMKDYLEEHGTNINPVTPRNVIKEAFSANIITDGQVWVDMLLLRNLLSHTYDFSKFQEVLDAVVKRYLSAQEQLHEWFLTRQMEPLKNHWLKPLKRNSFPYNPEMSTTLMPMSKT